MPVPRVKSSRGDDAGARPFNHRGLPFCARVGDVGSGKARVFARVAVVDRLIAQPSIILDARLRRDTYVSGASCVDKSAGSVDTGRVVDRSGVGTFR